jgi:hypothetical protein
MLEIARRPCHALREVYRTLDTPGSSLLKTAHADLDKAVREAYGMGKSQDPLLFLLDLNESVAAKEENDEFVVGPGLPPTVKNKSEFLSADRLAMTK